MHDVEIIYEKSNNAVSLNVENDFFKKDRKKFSSETIRRCRNLVYEHESRVVGIISYSADYIEGLFVHPAFWNRGIGSELLNSAAAENRGLRLQVYADNKRALDFYAKRGFDIVGKGICPLTNLPYLEMERLRSCGGIS